MRAGTRYSCRIAEGRAEEVLEHAQGQALADALSSASGMVFFATKESVASPNCLKELNFALDDDKPIFVEQLDDTPLPSLLRLALSDRQTLKRSELGQSAYRDRLIAALGSVVPREPRAAASEPDIVTRVPLIALEPLTTVDDEQAFWPEGFVDDLAKLLSRRALRIIRAPDSGLGAAELGRQLDADYVVSGTVRAGGRERLRVSFRLSDGTSAAQVWTDRFDGEGDPLDVADQLTPRAAAQTAAAVVDDQRRRSMDADVDSLNAWELCVRASGSPMNSRAKRDEIFQQLRLAVTRDPDFALAHACLASSLGSSVVTQFSSNPDADMAECLAHANRALELDPNEALALELAERAHNAG